MKVLLSTLGNERRYFQDFKSFLPVEMMAFFGLITLNGLTSRMRSENEFKTQEEDPAAGNDVCELSEKMETGSGRVLNYVFNWLILELPYH